MAPRPRERLSWPLARLGELIETLSRRSGLSPRGEEPLVPPEGLAQDPELVNRWIVAATGAINLEAEPVEVTYPEVESLVQGAGPAILQIAGEGEPRFVAVLRGGKEQVTLLGPDLKPHKVPVAQVRDALCQPL